MSYPFFLTVCFLHYVMLPRIYVSNISDIIKILPILCFTVQNYLLKKSVSNSYILDTKLDDRAKKIVFWKLSVSKKRETMINKWIYKEEK